MRQRRRVASLSAVVTMAAGLTAAPSAAAQSGADASPAQQEGAPVADAMPRRNVINMVVAKVNGAPILLSDLQSKEQDLLPVVRQQLPEAEVQAQLPELRGGFLQALIEEEMIAQRATQLGITADPNQVDRSIQSIREQQGLLTDEQFEQALAVEGMTIEQLRDQMATLLVQQRLIFEEVDRQLYVTDDEIATYYEENMDQFGAPARVRMDQLVFLAAGGSPAQLQRDALAALEELRGGASPQEVAARYATATFLSGGEAFTEVNDLLDELIPVAETLPLETYSEPVTSQHGLHIAWVNAREEQRVASLDEVRDAVRARLETEKRDERLAEYIQELRERTRVEILDPQYKAVEDAWSRQAEAASTTSERRD